MPSKGKTALLKRKNGITHWLSNHYQYSYRFMPTFSPSTQNDKTTKTPYDVIAGEHEANDEDREGEKQ